MFRLFFCYCLLKDTASFDFVSQEPAKISIPQEKSPLASRQTWGHRLCSAKAVCFPDFQPENIKKPKRRFGKITRRFRRIKRRFILLKQRSVVSDLQRFTNAIISSLFAMLIFESSNTRKQFNHFVEKFVIEQ